MSEFLRPKRRSVRQKSGFKVNGSTTGSQCRLGKTTLFDLKQNIKLEIVEKNIKFSKLFSDGTFIYGLGFYFKSNSNITVVINIKIINHKKDIINKSHKEDFLNINEWNRFYYDLDFVNEVNENDVYDVYIELIISNKNLSGSLEFFGLQYGAIDFYKNKADYKNHYYEKTDIYKPEIYYLDIKSMVDKSINIEGVVEEEKFGCLVLKSCNRCGRFLPIDIKNETNSLGFSNHCKKRAPCSHRAFSEYLIENNSDISVFNDYIKNNLIKNNNDFYIKTNLGFQLECRSCKKFVVNAPLNPLRNKAQHHEDGARRRSIERMIIELTNIDTVKDFRSNNGKEFQNYLWEKFDKKCFCCGKELKKIDDMHIDHTRPLVYLWRLDETATALCSKCNSKKHDSFPWEFYTKEQLLELSKKTGIDINELNSGKRQINTKISDMLIKNVTWFFDVFLSRNDYQKIREGKKSSDLIYKSLDNILSKENIDLIDLYFNENNKYPKSITINK